MKKGKEVKPNIFKNYKIVFGSVNNKTSKAVYINISAWAEPMIESDVNYTRIIKDLNKMVKQKIFNHLDSKENNFIRSIKLNRQPIDRLFITYDEIQRGGDLEFEIGCAAK